MDKAIWGVPRWGYFRWGVTKPLFDQALEVLEKQNERSPYVSREGSGVEGYEREGVLNALWFEALIKRLEKI
jgi:hypothetical protein